MTEPNKYDPFLTLPGIIVTTICATVGLCIFIPLLSENIEHGNNIRIALNAFNLAINAFCFYLCMRSVKRIVRKKQQPEVNDVFKYRM